MELRVLKYFLMVASEENITKAAELLHVTQPTLSQLVYRHIANPPRPPRAFFKSSTSDEPTKSIGVGKVPKELFEFYFCLCLHVNQLVCPLLVRHRS